MMNKSWWNIHFIRFQVIINMVWHIENLNHLSICLSNYYLYIYLSIVAEYYIGTNKNQNNIWSSINGLIFQNCNGNIDFFSNNCDSKSYQSSNFHSWFLFCIALSVVFALFCSSKEMAKSKKKTMREWKSATLAIAIVLQ